MKQDRDHVIELPTKEGKEVITLRLGQPVFLLGNNGTGKSALIYYATRKIIGKTIYLSGARPNYFENESLSMTPATRSHYTQNMQNWGNNADLRWRPFQGTTGNEKAVHDLQSAETNFAFEALSGIKNEATATATMARVRNSLGPLDRINKLLTQANLAVKLCISDAQLRCTRNGSDYSIARMSDGERAALIIAAEVIAADAETTFLIDEPELHIHRSIATSLFTSLFEERNDCSFLISTHDLELASAIPNATAVLVRGCEWNNDNTPRNWDIDVLQDVDAIPEHVRIEILGSRRLLLFVEGDSNSLDQPLYALLFPEVSVLSRRSCQEVSRAVKGLRTTIHLHHVEAYGLVDNDGMSSEQLSVLKVDWVYGLPIHTVESLYYAPEVMQALADTQHELLGITATALLDEAKSQALATLKPENLAHLASKLSQRKIRSEIFSQLPDTATIRAAQTSDIKISITSPYIEELARLNRLVTCKDLDTIVARYPIRDTGVLGALAKGLHFKGRPDFERAVLVRLGKDNSLREKLRDKLEALSVELGRSAR